MAFRFPARWRDREPGPNPLSEALAARRAAGKPLLDLTLSNPTDCGIAYPADWTAPLAAEAVRRYDPDPRGSPAARAAVARYYAGRGERIEPDALFLTAGTSEAYSHLFKLLCEPGDEALVPRPSYPLLETLAELADLKLNPYDLVPGKSDPEAGTSWGVDRESLEAALTPKTRVIFIVRPNNPTGNVLNAEDAEFLIAFAEKHGLALIVDEVFADYAVAPVPLLRSEGALVFTLNGLSKLLGLPQLKLAWIHVGGAPADAALARERLEWICDAHLSVGTASQHACAELLPRRAEFQEPIRQRIRINLGALRTIAAENPRLEVLWPQGGWCVPLRLRGVRDDEAFAIRLAETEGVLVQPGYFFDFEEENLCVLSLLVEPGIFREGLARLSRAVT